MSRSKKRLRGGNDSLYEEKIHCPMILRVMATKGTMTAFCKEAMISDGSFSRWRRKYPEFEECYQIGKMISKANWEEEGEHGQDDENFNLEYWRITGACRYGVGRVNRVRIEVDPEANPYEQYKQLIRQASGEEFSATEIKLLMESINVGRSTFEAFKLQGEVDAMKDDLNKMKVEHVNDNGSAEAVA